MKQVGSNCRIQSNDLDELRDEAYENVKIYKAQTKVFHNKIVSPKSFEPNQKVWLLILSIFTGKCYLLG